MKQKRKSVSTNPKDTKKNVKSKGKGGDKLTSLFVKPLKFPLPPQPKNFKQIEYNTETSKLTLIDYNNNKFECNLFGQELPTFKPYITGTAFYQKRKEMNDIKPLTFEIDTLYHPQTRKFEGYFPYPRPLSLPFINECRDPSLFIKALKNEHRMKTEKNQRLIALEIPLKDNKCKLSYLTSTLCMEESETKRYLIKMINDYIKELKIENKYTIDKVDKDPNVKALKRFKKILKMNIGEDCFNGKKIEKPNEKYKEDFSIMNTVIHSKKKEKNFIGDVYKELYSVRTVPKRDKENIECKNKYKEFKEETRETHYRTVSTGFGVTKNRSFFNHTSGSKLDEDNLSFISEEEKVEIIEKKPKGYREKENLINGFKIVILKNQAQVEKGLSQLKSSGAFYTKDLQFMEKVNPIAFKRERDKQLFEEKVMEKKKRNKLIYEKIKIKPS